MYILSFDCGIRNFAYSYVHFDDSTDFIVEPIDDFFKNNKYTVVSIDNVDVYKTISSIDEQNINKCTTSTSLHKALVSILRRTLVGLNVDDVFVILIEYQMPINRTTQSVYDIVATFFESFFDNLKKQNYHIYVIQPVYKNIIAQTCDVGLEYRTKYVNQYTYNKKIAIKYFTILNSRFNFLNLSKFKKKDDISDSFIQILVYFQKYHESSDSILSVEGVNTSGEMNINIKKKTKYKKNAGGKRRTNKRVDADKNVNITDFNLTGVACINKKTRRRKKAPSLLEDSV